jgi:hypothetical protein
VRPHRVQHAPRVDEVLEHVHQEHDVEPVADPGPHRRVLDVADDDAVGLRLGVRRGAGVDLERGDAAAARAERRGEGAGVRADLEHPRAGRHAREDGLLLDADRDRRVGTIAKRRGVERGARSAGGRQGIVRHRRRLHRPPAHAASDRQRVPDGTRTRAPVRAGATRPCSDGRRPLTRPPIDWPCSAP